MKKMYLTPELEILQLEQSDIITASGDQSGPIGGIGGGNEGEMDDFNIDSWK